METSKMLHGGRLGNVREDVANFTSSRKVDARLADAVLAINKAHVVMLMEQKIINWQNGAKILKLFKNKTAKNSILILKTSIWQLKKPF